MTQSCCSSWCWKLGLASSLVVGGTLAPSGNCTFAQITPDGTLGAESSVVTPLNSLTNQIDGGATRSTNLFHSFEQFSVPTNGEVRFNNDLNIQNIITRVTGSSPSTIDGLLKANGTANLFLINPNGIIFGSKASLNIGGSFLASTASSLNFADGTQFSATATQTTPLLRMSIPIGLQFGATAKEIRNQSRVTDSRNTIVGLQVPSGQTLTLIGGNVELEGGNLTAPGGSIELGSVASNSLVSLNSKNQGWALGYEGVQNFQDIRLSQQALVNASGEPGGNIQVQGRRVMLSGTSRIFSETTGSQPGGNLTITASESVELIGISPRGKLSTRTLGAGDAGDLTITTGKLIVQDGAQVLTSTAGEGSGGELKVNALESVDLKGANSVLFSSTVAAGDAGNITIDTGKLIVQNGAAISAESTSARIRGQTITATGQGGDLTVKASESVELIGGSVFTETEGSGRAGEIKIDTGRLIVRNAIGVSASTSGAGRGGNVKVNASDSVELSGKNSGLLSSTSAAGDAGDLAISTGNLIIQNGAAVTVSSEGIGDAGNLEITANSIHLNNQGKLTATSASGNGGDIKLQDLDLLLLQDQSQISTTAGSATGGAGNGGNITINTDVLVGLENSDITANAFEGEGGFIQITAQGIFGLEVNETDTIEELKGNNTSDISAASQKDPSLNGRVEINRPEAEPSSGLVSLPAELVDISRLIAQGCAASGGNVARGASKFVATGRGGLPPTPTEALRSDSALADLGAPVQSQDRANATSPNLTNSQTTPLIEAQGWVIGSKGEVILTAQAPTVTRIPWLTPTSCNAS